MSMEAKSEEISDIGIVYRNTGGEKDEHSLDSDMPLDRRINNFESALVELDLAKDALKQGVNKSNVNGSYEDISEAITILESTAQHGADQISDEELDQAIANKMIDPVVAQDLRSARSDGKTEDNDRYARLAEKSRDILPDRQQSSEEDQGQER